MLSSLVRKGLVISSFTESVTQLCLWAYANEHCDVTYAVWTCRSRVVDAGAECSRLPHGEHAAQLGAHLRDRLGALARRAARRARRRRAAVALVQSHVEHAPLRRPLRRRHQRPLLQSLGEPLRTPRLSSRASRTLCSTRTSPSPRHFHFHSVPLARAQDAGENGSLVWPAHAFAPRSAGEEFWLFGVLNISSGAFPLLLSCLCLCRSRIARRTEDCGRGRAGIFDLAGVEGPLLLALFAAWVITFLCLSRGIKSVGRVRRLADWLSAPALLSPLTPLVSSRLALCPVTRPKRSSCARVRAGGLRDGHRAVPAARHSPRARRIPRRRARRHSVLRAPALRAPPHPTHARPQLQPAGQRPLASTTPYYERFCS